MSQWYEHQETDKSSLWLYSERGLMSFLHCKLLFDQNGSKIDVAQRIFWLRRNVLEEKLRQLSQLEAIDD